MFLQLLVSLFTLLWPPPQVRIPGPGGTPAAASASGISLVNANSASAGAVAPVTTTLSVTAGNLIVVGASQYYGGVTFTVSDTVNTYTQIVAYAPASGLAMSAWWAKALTTATLTISVTGLPASLPNIAAIQCSGQSASPLVGYAVANGATSPLSTGTFSAGASPGNLIVVFAAGSSTAAVFSAGGAPSGLVIPANGQASGNGAIAVQYVVAGNTQTSANIAWVSGDLNQNVVGAVFH